MSHTIRRTADPARQEEFAGRMVEVLNDACLGYLCSLGHRTRLFDVMAGLPPSTSEEIADAAGLNERYVREWLGGVTVGGIVGYDPADGTYRLPPEHAASLCRAAGPDNLASFLQDLALIGLVEDEVVTAFRDGAGCRTPRIRSSRSSRPRRRRGCTTRRWST